MKNIIQINIWSKKIRPTSSWIFSYNLQNWSLDGFKKAWWSDIITYYRDTQGWASYWFDSKWMLITSNNYDDAFCLFIPTNDLLKNARSIHMEYNAYYVQWIWWNCKRLWLWSTPRNYVLTWALYSWEWTWWWHDVVDYYGSYWIFFNDTILSNNWKRWWRTLYTWDLNVQLDINLRTWLTTMDVTWSTNTHDECTLTSSQIQTVKEQPYFFFQKEEWYQYRTERLKNIFVEVK